MNQLPNDIDHIIEKIDSTLKMNPMAWGMLYFKHHFRDKSPLFHFKVLREALKHKYFAVAAPRGSAKSTIISFLIPAHGIAFKRYRFIVIVQNTYAKAAQTLETIKTEFKENPDLRKDFKIKTIKDSEGDSIFEHKDGFKVRVLCKGAEQIGSVRGEKFGAYRPDLILVDDLEDDEMVKNPERRASMQRLYDDALIPAKDPDKYHILVVGTILHDDALIAKLISKDHYPEYRKLKYRARYMNLKTKQLDSIWPERWSVEDLNKLEKLKPETFAKEYQNDPVSGLMSKFDKEDFRYWKVENGCYLLMDKESNIIGKGELRNCKAAISCDLAWEEKRQSDSTVILPGFLTPNNEYLFADYICEKGMNPDKLESYLFPMYERLRKITGKSVYIGFEKAKLEKVMKWFLKKAMQRRNSALMFKDLVWDNDKIQRIVTRLQPFYKQHMIFHKKGMGDMEHQLLRVPHGTHDDLPDAAQGLMQLFSSAPKVKEEKTEQEDHFDWLRDTVKKRKKKGNRFIFGKGKSLSSLPAKKSWK